MTIVPEFAVPIFVAGTMMVVRPGVAAVLTLPAVSAGHQTFLGDPATFVVPSVAAAAAFRYGRVMQLDAAVGGKPP
jgi:hypothetical protein